LKTTNL